MAFKDTYGVATGIRELRYAGIRPWIVCEDATF